MECLLKKVKGNLQYEIENINEDTLHYAIHYNQLICPR